MADPKTDFENMTDEDFLKLDENDFSGNVPDGETSLTNEEANAPVQVSNEPDSEVSDSTDTSAGNTESDQSDDDDTTSTDGEEETSTDTQDPGQTDPHADDDDTSSGEQSEADPEEEGETTDDSTGSGDVGTGEGDEKKEKVGKDTPAKAGYYKLPDGVDTATVDEALGFHKIMTTPFKADGKDFTVRSPEDAIRLMQQGVNYSRRMQEIKPMKQLNRMLTDQGLNDPEKLNFLIDLSKGDKAAVTQLLKTHNIDPMDLDLEKDSGYQARNYQGDPQDHAFRDALDNALANPEGQALVSHIHQDWDAKSKARLREDPSILGTLQEFKASGVYDKVVEELKYQRGLGYLVDTPFLQAFDQVGEAMKKIGVFDSDTHPAQNGNSMAPLNSGQPQSQPVASGARKSTTTKKVETNPHLSSTPPAKQTGNTSTSEPDFAKMSDEEFLKMPPPE